MNHNDLLVAELLTAKFSHDISGPVGAINNGVEFLTEAEFEMKDQAIALVETSAQEAVARIQFFRTAYGVTKETGEANIDKLKKLINDYFSFGKCEIEWSVRYVPDSPFVINQMLSKLLINIIIIAKSSVLIQGKLHVNITELSASEVSIEVIAEGKKIKLPDDYIILTIDDLKGFTLSTRNIQIYYTKRLADYLGTKISVDSDDERFVLRTTHRKATT
ncbi:MAG: histidine phosphotransferase family protein [Rickettsiales bacterium]|nr:histidine phosphotransferase family protein [Rickettsiales bacterium]